MLLSGLFESKIALSLDNGKSASLTPEYINVFGNMFYFKKYMDVRLLLILFGHSIVGDPSSNYL